MSEIFFSFAETISSALMRRTGNEKTDEKKSIWIKPNVKKWWVSKFLQQLDENISLLWLMEVLSLTAMTGRWNLMGHNASFLWKIHAHLL